MNRYEKDADANLPSSPTSRKEVEDFVKAQAGDDRNEYVVAATIRIKEGADVPSKIYVKKGKVSFIVFPDGRMAEWNNRIKVAAQHHSSQQSKQKARAIPVILPLPVKDWDRDFRKEAAPKPKRSWFGRVWGVIGSTASKAKKGIAAAAHACASAGIRMGRIGKRIGGICLIAAPLFIWQMTKKVYKATKAGWIKTRGTRRKLKKFPVWAAATMFIFACYAGGFRFHNLLAAARANSEEQPKVHISKPGPAKLSVKQLDGGGGTETGGNGNNGSGDTGQSSQGSGESGSSQSNAPQAPVPSTPAPIGRDCTSSTSGQLTISACASRATGTVIEVNGTITNNSARDGVLSLQEHGMAYYNGYATPVMHGGMSFGTNWHGTIPSGTSVNFTARFIDESAGSSQQIDKFVLYYYWRDEMSGTFTLSDILIGSKKDSTPDGSHHAPSGNFLYRDGFRFYKQTKIPHYCGILGSHTKRSVCS